MYAIRSYYVNFCIILKKLTLSENISVNFDLLDGSSPGNVISLFAFQNQPEYLLKRDIGHIYKYSSITRFVSGEQVCDRMNHVFKSGGEDYTRIYPEDWEDEYEVSKGADTAPNVCKCCNQYDFEEGNLPHLRK